MNALVVESQRPMRSIIRKMLLQMRCFDEVLEADSGNDAWSKLSTSGIELILSDIDLTGSMNGLELLKRCRNDSDLRSVMFVVVSASAHEAIIASALGEWGAQDFIVKPFSHEVLSRRIRLLLKSAESPHETLFREAAKLKFLGMTDDALKVIEHWEAENTLPRAKWLNLKGECLMEAGQEDLAAVQFENAMAASSVFIAAYRNYADANEKLGKVDEAIKTLKQVESLSPTNADRTLELGRLLLMSGEAAEGKLYLQNLIKRSVGAEKDAAFENVGQLYLDTGEFEEAEAIFAAKLIANPANIEISNQLAIAFRQQRKYDKAEQCYMDTLKSHVDHTGVLHNLGILYLTMKAYDKAENILRRALRIAPDFEDAKELLRTVREERKKKPSESPRRARI